MQTQTQSLHPFFKQVFIVLLFLMVTSQANAQRGVIVIQGEITAPTCVLNNMLISSLGIVQSVHWKDCVGNKTKISPNAVTEIAQIREDAMADNSNKRIRTITYR